MQTALSLAVPVTGIAEAVFARGLSSEADLREEAQKQGFAGPDGKLNLNDDEKKAFIEDIRQALYASKIVAYAQGFNEITTAAKEYGWDIDLAAVARIWRGGCIIRAKFLNRISEAFESGEANVSLLFAPYFKNAIENAEKSWRNVGRPGRHQRSADPGVRLVAVLLDGCVPSVCRPPSSRASATTSAPTPTSAWTSRARSTPCGPSRAAKRSKPDLFLASVSGRICQRSCDVFHCKTSGICILLSCDIAVPLH